MTLERITKSILAVAERDVERILHSAQMAAQKKIASAKEEQSKNFAERLKTVEAELEEKKAIELSNLSADHRQQLLETKNAIIEDVFKMAMEQFTSLPDNKYLAIIEKWLQTVNTAGQIYIGSSDSKRINQKFISRVNRTRKEPSKFSLSNDLVEISGGFILKTEKFELDYSLETMVSILREPLRPIIAKELFGEQS